MDSVVGHLRAPELPAHLDWVNVESPPSLRRLRGKIVLLDFWTSCCINCHHDLLALRRLARTYADVLAVLGVHSAKFPAERSTEILRQAVMRFDVEHPVVNDAELGIWESYTVHAWPTTVLIDPEGRIRAQKRGEITFEEVAERVELMVDHFGRRGLLQRGPIEVAPERHREPERRLRFPAGLTLDGDRLFVADTGHHRILELQLEPESEPESDSGPGPNPRARWVRTFGDGQPGHLDGPADGARFHHPHGMASSDDHLFVADTDNHAVRAVRLPNDPDAVARVATVAGTGQLETAPRVGRADQPSLDARSTALRSPWDLVREPVPADAAHHDAAVSPGTTLLLTMAGSHQVFRLCLGDGLGSDGGGRLELVAGNGREALIDGVGDEASFDQPSGLVVAGRGRSTATAEPVLFVADAEASGVRRIELGAEGARVSTVVGTGLFAFGDRDGIGDEALLQHPTGITWLDGQLYLTDSFNHKVRRLDPDRRATSTVAGTGSPGLRDATSGQDGEGSEALFFEPEAIEADERRRCLWVADTNNHRIRCIDRLDSEVRVRTLEILEPGPSQPGPSQPGPSRDD